MTQKTIPHLEFNSLLRAKGLKRETAGNYIYYFYQHEPSNTKKGKGFTIGRVIQGEEDSSYGPVEKVEIDYLLVNKAGKSKVFVPQRVLGALKLRNIAQRQGLTYKETTPFEEVLREVEKQKGLLEEIVEENKKNPPQKE